MAVNKNSNYRDLIARFKTKLQSVDMGDVEGDTQFECLLENMIEEYEDMIRKVKNPIKYKYGNSQD